MSTLGPCLCDISMLVDSTRPDKLLVYEELCASVVKYASNSNPNATARMTRRILVNCLRSRWENLQGNPAPNFPRPSRPLVEEKFRVLQYRKDHLIIGDHFFRI